MEQNTSGESNCHLGSQEIPPTFMEIEGHYRVTRAFITCNKTNNTFTGSAVVNKDINKVGSSENISFSLSERIYWQWVKKNIK
jgi:hypothetical protein